MTTEPLTMRLNSVFSVTTDQLLKGARNLPVATVNKFICGGLILWLLLILSQLIGLFTSSDSTPVTAPADTAVAVATPQQGQKTDIAKLLSINLLGVAGDAPQPVAEVVTVEDDAVLNASKTKLNLVLEGIVYTADAAGSVAVIVYQNKQDQYYIGDKLPVGNKVLLAKVMLDHVILDNAGRYESLWLYDEEKLANQVAKSVSNSSISRSGVTDVRKNANATQLASGYRDRHLICQFFFVIQP